MANSKVMLADGTTLIDLTSDTVSAGTLACGTTAHGADGAALTGTAKRVFEKTVFCLDPNAKTISCAVPFAPGRVAIRSSMAIAYAFPEQVEPGDDPTLGEGEVFSLEYAANALSEFYDAGGTVEALFELESVPFDAVVVQTEDQSAYTMLQEAQHENGGAVVYANGVLTADLSRFSDGTKTWKSGLLEFAGISQNATVPQIVDAVYAAYCGANGGEENMSAFDKAMWRMIAVVYALSNTYRLIAWEI